jgi:hypothetical protein
MDRLRPKNNPWPRPADALQRCGMPAPTGEDVHPTPGISDLTWARNVKRVNRLTSTWPHALTQSRLLR